MGIGAIEKMAHELRNFNKFFNYSESFFCLCRTTCTVQRGMFFWWRKAKTKKACTRK